MSQGCYTPKTFPWNLSFMQQEAFEKCRAHSPLRAAERRLFYIAIHQVSLLSHAAGACASMSITTSTTTTTTTTRDRGDRYGPMELAIAPSLAIRQLTYHMGCRQCHLPPGSYIPYTMHTVYSRLRPSTQLAMSILMVFFIVHQDFVALHSRPLCPGAVLRRGHGPQSEFWPSPTGPQMKFC